MARLSHNLNEEKPVCIHIIGRQLIVDPPTVVVSIPKRTRVHWFLVDAGRIDEITFKSKHPAPFHHDHDYASNKTHVLSDVVMDQNHNGKTFPYRVVVTPKGGTPITLDPDVEVEKYPWGPGDGQTKGRRRK